MGCHLSRRLLGVFGLWKEIASRIFLTKSIFCPTTTLFLFKSVRKSIAPNKFKAFCQTPAANKIHIIDKIKSQNLPPKVFASCVGLIKTMLSTSLSIAFLLGLSSSLSSNSSPFQGCSWNLLSPSWMDRNFSLPQTVKFFGKMLPQKNSSGG